MIDIHMLVLPCANKAWKDQAIALIPSWATLHIIDSEYGPIGPQRLAAFRRGHHKYVSCIDPDDWTEPDTFDRCLAELEAHNYRGVCTLEVTHDFLERKEYVTPYKHKTFVVERSFIEEREALYRFNMNDREVVQDPEVIWLPFIGHHWRRYNSAGKKVRKSLQKMPEGSPTCTVPALR